MSEIAVRLTELSEQCWTRGRVLPSLAMKKLFETPGEAYHAWNAALPSYVAPHAEMARPFETADDLRAAFRRAIEIREALRAEMIALQEEMDWLVYEAYGLADFGLGILDFGLDKADSALDREDRPFRLWAKADGNYEKAVLLIPAAWSPQKRRLWETRLAAIRDNEHIRRIEQPVYKRRWDEQWKVGGRWQCGEPAYDAEFLDAFSWWLSEKAEWWLETQKSGGPVTLDDWTAALWADSRVQAAWAVAAEARQRLEQWKKGPDRSERVIASPDAMTGALRTGDAMTGALQAGALRTSFAKFLKALVKDQSVPADIPWAVPWAELEKTMKVPASVKRLRGKLNVPRERFRTTTAMQYVGAGRKL